MKRKAPLTRPDSSIRLDSDCVDPPIESTILHRKSQLHLPPEHAPVQKSGRPRNALNSNSIFSNLSVPYDLSHRRPSTKQRRRPPSDPETPNFVACVPPRGKFWVAPQRKAAAELRHRLHELERGVADAARHAESPFDATTMALEKSLTAHQQILDEFTAQAAAETPERGGILHRIADFYRQLADEIPTIKATFADDYARTQQALDEVKAERQQLEGTRDGLLAAIDHQVKTIDALTGQIKDFQTRCSNAEAQLRDVQNDAISMTRSSQTNQLKLVEIGKQIVEKRQQEVKLSALIETLSKDLTARTGELQSTTVELQGIEGELARLRSEMNSYKQIQDDRIAVCEKLRKTPLRDKLTGNRPAQAIQCNVVPKRQTTKQISAAMITTAIDGEAQFAQTKSDMQAIQRALGTDPESNRIVINSIEDLQKVRDTMLQNNAVFNFSVTSIMKAHAGDFRLAKTTPDECRVYAEWMMRRIMKNALASRSVSLKQTQTQTHTQIDEVQQIILPPSSEVVAEEAQSEEKKHVLTEKVPKQLRHFIKKSRFVQLLQTDYSDRPPKSFDWLIHAIPNIYDEKTVDDRTNIRDSHPIPTMPQYLLTWAFRQFGRNDLIQKGCWDLFITSHFYMQRSLDVAMFVRFLDEDLTVEQLTFFLNCRAWIIQHCVTIPVNHDDLGVYYAETYLTAAQVDELFHTTFKHTEPELIDDLTIRGWQCVDPIRAKENDAANIPMVRVLELAVAEQHDEKVRRLRKMLAFYRPVPRMTFKRFTSFVQAMISNIDPNMTDSLYRSANAPNAVRVDMDQSTFIECFRHFGKPIVPQGWEGASIGADEFADLSQVYSVVLTRWKQFSPFLNRMLKNIRADRTEVKALVSEIRHQLFQMLEAKVSFDGICFYQNYHRLLQTVVQTCLTLNLPDPVSFAKQVGDFHALLVKKYQTVLAANDGVGLDDNEGDD
jgi:hypothetical protein